MPSRRATRRASSTVLGEQQLPKRDVGSDASRHGQTRRVTPIASIPSSTRSAAATEESTPPLIPTTTRSGVTALISLCIHASSQLRADALADVLRPSPELLEQTLQFVAADIRDLDPATGLAADESDPCREPSPQGLLGSDQIGRPSTDMAPGPRLLPLYTFLGQAHRPGVLDDLVAEPDLLSRRRERQKGSRVAHGEPARAEIRLDLFGKLQ